MTVPGWVDRADICLEEAKVGPTASKWRRRPPHQPQFLISRQLSTISARGLGGCARAGTASPPGGMAPAPGW